MDAVFVSLYLEVFRLVAISSLSLFLRVRYCLEPFALCSIDLCEFGLLSRECEFISISVIDANQLWRISLLAKLSSCLWTFISFSNALFTTVWCELISVSPLPSDRLLPVIYYLPDAPSIKPDIHNSSIFNKWPFRVLTYLISNCMCCTLRYLWSIIVL